MQDFSISTPARGIDVRPDSAGKHARWTGGLAGRLSPSLAALVVWLVSLPVAFALARLGPPDPFILRVAMIPVVLAVAGVAVVGVVSRRLPAELASGIGAGLAGGWICFTLRLALHGTKYGFNGLSEDAGRLASFAATYSKTWFSTDGIVRSVPSNYPPLFPWLVGRASAITGVPAWELLGPAGAIALSFAVVAGYLLWRRLLPGPLALALTMPVLLVYNDPSKSYEILALEIFIPWAIATFGSPPKGRLHWVPAGIVGGLLIVLYWGYILYAAIGIVALVVVTWRASTERRKYVLHLVATIILAAVVASWYLVPYGLYGLMHQTSQDEYQFQGDGLQDSPLTFLAATPLGVLELIGVIGMAWFRGRVWWGKPLILLTAGTYAYWLIGLADFVVNDHQLQLQYTPRLIGPLLAAAGILTLVHAAPALARRFSIRSIPAGLPTLALCLLLTWTAITAWQAWMPGGPGKPTRLLQPAVTVATNQATRAFTNPYPDGTYPAAGPASRRLPWFPVSPIEQDVTSVLGPNAEPTTLSDSDHLFSFVTWPGYIGVARGAAAIDSDWPARYAALVKLSNITDPAQFAAASARTPFGSLDVFVLQVVNPTTTTAARWSWIPTATNVAPVRFSPTQFDAAHFTVFDLPNGYVVAVRNPAKSG